MRRVGISLVCICGLIATARGQSGKPDFSGKWQSQNSGKALTLAIDQKGASIHVVRTSQSGGKDSTVEFSCTTDGKDCQARGMKVSLWYDGASLVEMDVSDAVVSTTKMTLDNPNTISVTVSYMSPKADPESFVLQKI